MQIVRRLARIFSTLVILFIAIYASFPWWAKTVIERGLPQGWRLSELNAEYPYGSDISLAFLTLESTDLNIRAEAVSFNLFSRQLFIKNLRGRSLANDLATLPAASKNPIALLQLPEINFNRILASLPVSAVGIERLDWHLTQSMQAEFGATNFQLTAHSPTHASLKTRLTANPWLNESVDVALDLNYRRGEWLGDISLDNVLLVSAGFRNANDSQQLRVVAPIEAMAPWMPRLSQQFDSTLIKALDIKGQFELQILQNLITSNTSRKLTLSGDFLPKGLTNQRVNFAIDTINDSADWPMQMPLDAKLWSNAPLQLMDRISMQLPTVELHAQLLISPQEIRVSQIAGEFIDPQIQLPLDDKQLFINQAAANFKHADIRLGQFDITNSHIQINLPGSHLEVHSSADENNFSGLLSGKLQLSGQNNLDGKIYLAEPQFTNLYVSKGKPLTIEFKQLQTDLNKGSISLSFLDKKNLLAGFNFDSLRAEFLANFSSKAISGQGEVWLNDEPLAPVKFALQKSAGRINLLLPSHLIANKLFNQIVTNWLPEKALKMTLDQGELHHQGQLISNVPFSFRSQVELTNGKLTLGKAKVRQLSVAAIASITDSLHAESQISADEVLFSSGLSMTQVSASANLQNGQPTKITHLKLKLLGGDMSSEEITLEGSNIISAPFEIRHLSLEQLSQVIDLEGLSLQGEVDVTGKIKFIDSAILIEQFNFISTKPGAIRYDKGEALGLTNNIAAQALQNFNFREFEGEIVNATANSVPLKLRLLGSSPELKLDREMEFSITLNNEVNAKELTELLARFLR